MSASVSKNNPSLPEIFAFQQVSKPNLATGQNLSLQEMIADSGIFQVIDTAGFDFPNFPETNKKFRVVYLNLSSGFEGIKPILNGYLALGQPSGVYIGYDKDQNQYAVKYYLENENIVSAFVSKIRKFIYDEIRFKKVLSRVIADQKAFESAQKLLLRELIA